MLICALVLFSLQVHLQLPLSILISSQYTNRLSNIHFELSLAGIELTSFIVARKVLCFVFEDKTVLRTNVFAMTEQCSQGFLSKHLNFQRPVGWRCVKGRSLHLTCISLHLTQTDQRSILSFFCAFGVEKNG